MSTYGGATVIRSLLITLPILLISSAIAQTEPETPGEPTTERVPDDVLKSLGLDGLVPDSTEEEAPALQAPPLESNGAPTNVVGPAASVPPALPLPPPPDLPRQTGTLTIEPLPAPVVEPRSPAIPVDTSLKRSFDRFRLLIGDGVTVAAHTASHRSLPMKLVGNNVLQETALRSLAAVDLVALQRKLERALDEKDAAYIQSVQQLNATARRFETLQRDLTQAQADAERKRQAADEAETRVRQLTGDLNLAADQLRAADLAAKQAARELARINRKPAASTVTPLTVTVPR